MKNVALILSFAMLIWVATFIADIYDWPPQPPTEYDEIIVLRAIELLTNESVWDKNDNHQCQKNAIKLSLYCALKRASYETSGSFHHESAVMEAVRDVIETQHQDATFSHLLMGFNNAPSVKLNDLHDVLVLAKHNLKIASQ